MQAQFNQALVLQQQGQLQQAESIFRNILTAEPDQPIVNARLGMLLHQQNRHSEALTPFGIAISALPKELELVMQGVDAAVEVGEHILSERWLCTILSSNPDHLVANEKMAGVMIALHKESEALKISKRLIKLDPQNAVAYNIKGMALSRMGDTEKGYKSFQKAVRLNPGQLGVIRNLILHGKGKKEPILDSLVPQLEKKLKQDLPPQVQMNMAYIISMYYERRKLADKAFAFLKIGNDINRSTLPYSNESTEEHFETLKNAFSQNRICQIPKPVNEDESAIFVLGMPRSGTTLIEQIISSHSLVEPEGEIKDLKVAFEENAEILDLALDPQALQRAIQSVAERYIDGVRQRQSSRYFTDKMPYNFMLIGLIATALPNAKIIHCTRDPLETCFSIYKQNFSGSHAYSNNLEDLAHYYRSYADLMAYWKEQFGDQIYEASYEEMVGDSELQIGKLLQFCGLSAEQKCFDFHKNKRAVRTASVAQVRQPIYKDSIKASTPYVGYLAPLIEALAAP